MTQAVIAGYVRSPFHFATKGPLAGPDLMISPQPL